MLLLYSLIIKFTPIEYMHDMNFEFVTLNSKGMQLSGFKHIQTLYHPIVDNIYYNTNSNQNNLYVRIISNV